VSNVTDQSPLQQGLECLKDRKVEEAIQHLERATAYYPNDYQAFNYLGVAYAQKGFYDRAVGAFQTAVHLRADVPSIHYNLGLAYQADGFLGRAREQFEKALELDPNYQKAAEAVKALGTAEQETSDAISSQACARHIDEPAVGVCAFCHLPVCRECRTEVDGEIYCVGCSVRARQG
jgi:tetratricopeptide (TPR) repeat protein